MPRRRDLLASGTALAATLAGRRLLAGPAVVKPVHRQVQQRLRGMPTQDGAGVSLTRVIGQPALRHLDPFLMLDRFHSDDPGAYIAGFPDHPHRGFETVTVMLAGRMRHRDSRGNAGLITGGGAQWMTAGRGIVHSEMPEQERGLMSGYQLWVNLPAREKLCPQAYQDLQPDRLTEARLGRAGSQARVIAGRVDGLNGAGAGPPDRPAAADAGAGGRPAVRAGAAAGAHGVRVRGGGRGGGGAGRQQEPIAEGTLGILGPGNRLRLRALNRRSELLVAAGRPLNEPIVQRGPFVMNTEAEIARAIADYRAGVLDR